VRAQAAVPTLRSFLKLYTSLDASKLAGFLDADEEEMVQQMMAVKSASRCVSRVAGCERGLLDGQMISTSDLDFVIDQVRFLAPLSLSLTTLTAPRSSPPPLEHGAYLRVYRRSPLRWLVHPQYGACTARAAWCA